MILSDPGGLQWYAIWTRSRCENLVYRQLLVRGIDTLLPTVLRWSQWKDRKKQTAWPMFPSYCFASFNLAESLRVLKCVGVVNIVSFAGKPSPLAESEVHNLRLLADNSVPAEPCVAVTEGALVTVVKGPLQGVTGRVLREDNRRITVVLSVALTGLGIRIEVDAASVRLTDGCTSSLNAPCR